MSRTPPECLTLALDPGSSFTGWCRSDGVCGTIAFRPYQDHGAGLCHFQDWLSDQMADGVGLLLIERPGHHMRAANADFVHGQVWAAHAIACRYGVARREMRADSVRKALIGRSRRNKGESVRSFDKVMLEAVTMAGLLPGNEHETDAAALLLVGSGTFKEVTKPI